MLLAVALSVTLHGGGPAGSDEQRTNPMPLLLVLLLTLVFSAFATDLGFAADRPLATTFLEQNLEMVSFGGLGGFGVPKCIAPLKYIENYVYGDLSC